MRFIEPIEEGNIYHIYNRGINSEDIFKAEDNFYKFLEKYEEYCAGILETYAYALLKNHFHLMVKVKENVFEERKDGKGKIKINASKQLSHFFNSYAQTINNAFDRHGKLFEEPFKRKLVGNDRYFTSLIYYIHFNPQHHHFVKDFKDWEFTSYHSFLNDKDRFLEKSKVIEWFGTTDRFINAHGDGLQVQDISDWIIE